MSTYTDVMGAVDALQYHGGYPFTAEAFQLATDIVFTDEHGDRLGATNYIILFTGSMEIAEFDLPSAHDLQHDKVLLKFFLSLFYNSGSSIMQKYTIL